MGVGDEKSFMGKTYYTFPKAQQIAQKTKDFYKSIANGIAQSIKVDYLANQMRNERTLLPEAIEYKWGKEYEKNPEYQHFQLFQHPRDVEAIIKEYQEQISALSHEVAELKDIIKTQELIKLRSEVARLREKEKN